MHGVAERKLRLGGWVENDQRFEGQWSGAEQEGEWGDSGRAVGLEWDSDDLEFAEEKCGGNDGTLRYG